MSEGVERLSVIMLVAAIADEDAFLIDDAVRIAFGIVVRVGGVVFSLALERDGKMTGRIDRAEQCLGERGPALLTRVPACKVRGHAINPLA